MKFTAAAGALSTAMSLAATAAVRSKKTGAPVHVVAADGAVCFMCSGLGITIKVKAEANIEGPGAEVVSADKLTDLVAGFPGNSPITLSSATNALTITGSAAKYRLPIYPDAPAALALDSEIASTKMPCADFLRLLDVVSAAGTEQTRFILCGVHLRTIGNRLSAEATDGTKLLRDSVVAGEFADSDRRLIVPTRAVALAQKLIRTTKAQQVTLQRSLRLFSVTAPSFEFVTRLVDGVYPDLTTRVVPAVGPNALTCARADLVAALVRLTAVADGELPLCALAWFDRGPLQVVLPRQPRDAADIVAAKASGAARIAFSLPQLQAMIGNFDSDRIHLTADGDGPLLLRGDGEKLGVLMGCRWNFNNEKEVVA